MNKLGKIQTSADFVNNHVTSMNHGLKCSKNYGHKIHLR